MTIKKSYYFQIEHNDGSIDHIVRKGKTEAEAQRAVEQEFPDAYGADCLGRLDYRKELERRRRHNRVPVFRNWGTRGGKFIYQHKGRKKRGCKNYPRPRRGWGKVRGPIMFTWTETYSRPVADFMERWVGFIAQDIGSVAPVEKSNEPAPMIVIDSLGMLDEKPNLNGVVFDREAMEKALSNMPRGMTVDEANEHLRALRENASTSDSLAGRALECARNGDFAGMMLHAKDLPGIENIKGIHDPHGIFAAARGGGKPTLLLNILDTYIPERTFKSDIIGTMAREMGVPRPRPEFEMDVEAPFEVSEELRKHILDDSVKDLYPDIKINPDLPNKSE